MNRMRMFVASAVLILTLSAIGFAQGIVVKHELGETVVQPNPQRVVVFDFGILDSLDALGIEPVGLPKAGTVPSYLSKYQDAKYANVGSLVEPNLEQVYALRPDLIIISTRQADFYEEFTRIAPTVYMALDTSDYMASFKHNMRLLGQIFGKSAEIEERIAEVESKVNALREQVTSRKATALVVMVNDKAVSAYGPQSRYGLIHDAFGFVPAQQNIVASTHGMTISFEFILAANPEYLFVIDRGAVVGGNATAKQVIENQLVRFTKAYQEGKIVYLDPEFWYISGGGFVSVSSMVDEVAAAVK